MMTAPSKDWPAEITLVRDVCDPPSIAPRILADPQIVERYPDEYEVRQYVPAKGVYPQNPNDLLGKLAASFKPEPVENPRELREHLEAELVRVERIIERKRQEDGP